MNRIVWLLLGFLYMFGIAAFASQAFAVPFPVAMVAVIITFALLTYLLSILCVRFSNTSEDDRRFQISTILLVMCYLSAYLAFFRAVISAFERNEGQIRFESWMAIIMPLIGATMFFVFTTIVLLHMGDAVMFLLNKSVRVLSKPKTR